MADLSIPSQDEFQSFKSLLLRQICVEADKRFQEMVAYIKDSCGMLWIWAYALLHSIRVRYLLKSDG